MDKPLIDLRTTDVKHKVAPMKHTARVVALVIPFVALTLFGADNPPKNEALQAGRFQLVAADVDIGTKQGTANQRKFVFRLDTATGETCYFHSAYTTEGEHAEYWKPISTVDQWVKFQEAIKAYQAGKTNSAVTSGRK